MALVGVGTSNSEDQRGVEGAGLGVLVLGTALFGVGLALAYANRGTHTPAATTWWTLPGGGANPSSVAP